MPHHNVIAMISKTYYRYIWLLNTLLDSDPLSFEEIALLWQDDPLSDGELPLRTFHEHRKGIKEMFGIDIECKKSDGFRYYVKNPGALSQKRLAKWLLNAYRVPKEFATYNRMQDRVILEEIPGGKAYVDPVLEALQREVMIVVDYQSYDGPHEIYNVCPYALKAYDRRWYLLGYIKEKDAIRSIALDRILDLKITNKTFDRPKDFDARKYYANNIGIFVNEDLSVETVRIRAYGVQMEYLRALPLHKSQEETKSKLGEYAEFQYRVCITPELISALLSMGEKMEVLEPEGLREEMRKRINDCLTLYI